jgi:kynureninase
MATFESARSTARNLDSNDPLAFARDRFVLPEGVIYLDGNSLGPVVKGVPERIGKAVQEEWSIGLIRSWNDAGWYPAPQRVGALIARLIGAKPNEVIACDSTSINLFKVLCAAVKANPDRSIIIGEQGNFPTDAYIVQSVADLFGKSVLWADQSNIQAKILEAGQSLCVAALTHVHYKTGEIYELEAVTQAVQASGARMVWDLAHSAGVFALQLNAAKVEYAVGCGYKYLNGGPGAPAFVYVREDLISTLDQPLAGWHGHQRPFAFDHEYTPHAGIDRLLVGTAPQISLLALESSLQAYEAINLASVRKKSQELTQLFIDLYDGHLKPLGFGLATPRAPSQRGSQVSFTHEHGYAIVQALIARGVIGDFRAPNILRFGFAPLYVRFSDVIASIELLVEIMNTNAWNQPAFLAKKSVT